MSEKDKEEMKWGKANLPNPPSYDRHNLFKIIGPGAILLAASIGGGEWLVGPALAVQFGVEFMWIATLSIFFQVIFNLEGIRYTLYTGEPVYGGFLRLAPGRRFWAVYYSLIAFLNLGWPGLASASASTLFASFSGRLPADSDSHVVYWIATIVIFLVLLILSFGGTIETMLERASYLIMGFVFLFLLVVNLLFIPLSRWLVTLQGFFKLTVVTGKMDWSLLAALAASAGAGGIGNLTVTSWVRDKGMGMARYVGAIPSAFGGVKLQLSPVGKIFPITAENMRRWKVWQKFVHADQLYLWGLLAFVGMFLNVNLATGVIPWGTDLSGMATGTYQAKYMAEHLWTGFWTLALLNGFLVLFSTHLGDTDILVRTVADVIWMGSPETRRQRVGSIKTIYYFLLGGFTFWAFFAVRLAQPLTLFKISANVSAFVLVVASFQIFVLNRRFLPREIRSPWREWVLIACGLFYSFFLIRVVFF